MPTRESVQKFGRFEILTVIAAMFEKRLAEDQDDLVRFLSFVIGTAVKPEEIDCAMEFCHSHLMTSVRYWKRWEINVKSVFKHVDRFQKSGDPEDDDSAEQLIVALRQHIQAADIKSQGIGNMDRAQQRWRNFKKQCLKRSST